MEENNENVVDETTQEQTVETVDESKFDSAGDDSVIKVDLTKPSKTEEDADTKQSTNEVPVRDGSETSEKVSEENVEAAVEELTGKEEEQTVQDEKPVVEEITN